MSRYNEQDAKINAIIGPQIIALKKKIRSSFIPPLAYLSGLIAVIVTQAVYVWPAIAAHVPG
jgi:hypothetical protein